MSVTISPSASTITNMWVVRPGVGFNYPWDDPYQMGYRVGVLFTDEKGTWEGVDIVGGTNTYSGTDTFTWNAPANVYVKQVIVYENKHNTVIERIDVKFFTTSSTGPVDITIHYGLLHDTNSR